MLAVIATIAISFSVFKSFWINTINTLWVEPVMVKIYNIEYIWPIITYFIIVVAYYYGIYKFKEKYECKRAWYILGFVAIYLMCFFSGEWDYLPITQRYPNIAWTHVILLLIIIAEITLSIKIKNNRKKRIIEDTHLEYEVTRNVDDSYQRLPMCNTIAQIISKNFSEEESFAIGISGDWGSGKTTFMNQLYSNLKGCDATISLIKFEPWRNDSPNTILRAFFNQLQNELQKYTTTIPNHIKEYLLNLLSENSDSISKVVRNTKDLLFHSDKEDSYEKLKKELKGTRHKTVIFIDDIDRLNADEIREVFRLIRNTANFPYIQFIVTYDKKYIISTLKAEGMENPSRYMEKIFNMEFSLPKFENRVICHELSKRIKETIKDIDPDREEVYIDDLIYMTNESTHIIMSYIIPQILPTARDVIRYNNSFKTLLLAYKQQNCIREINLRDLICLELIRYGSPELYNTLSRYPLSLLKNENNRLKIDEKSDCYQELKKNVPIRRLVDCLFKSFGNNQYRISQLRCFNNYFMGRMDRYMLSDIEFYELLNMEEDTVLEKAEELYKRKYPREFHIQIIYVLNKLAKEYSREKKSYFKIFRFLKYLSELSSIQDLKKEIASAFLTHIFMIKIIDEEHLSEILNLWEDMDVNCLEYYSTDSFYDFILNKEKFLSKKENRQNISFTEQQLIAKHLKTTKHIAQRNYYIKETPYSENITIGETDFGILSILAEQK